MVVESEIGFQHISLDFYIVINNNGELILEPLGVF